MLAGLTISVFSGEKVDRKVSEEVALTHNTTASKAGKFSKRIINKVALEGIDAIAGRARALHYERTLPWSDNAGRLLSIVGFMDYTAEMGLLSSKFASEIDKFIDLYPRMIEEAKTRLNGMFDVNDYPDISGMRERFSFDINISPLPTGSTWFLDMADEEMNVLRASIDERCDNGIKDAIKDVYGQVAEVTKIMHEKLTAYEVHPETGKVAGGIFRDSLIGNVAKLADLLPSLNLTNDPALAEIGDRMRNELCKFDAAALRAEPEFREATATAALKLHELAASYRN
jgi:hypothetical protein